jgi:hypothetical protein
VPNHGHGVSGDVYYLCPEVQQKFPIYIYFEQRKAPEAPTSIHQLLTAMYSVNYKIQPEGGLEGINNRT